MGRLSRVWIGTAAAAALATATPAQGSDDPSKLTFEQSRQLADDLDAFRKATRPEERGRRFGRMIELGTPGAGTALRHLEDRLAELRGEYVLRLQRWLPDAYEQRLIELDHEQIVAVQRARRLWKSYVLYGGHRKSFQAEFLDPMQEAARILLIRAEEVQEPTLHAQRAELVELAGYRKQARGVLGIDPDPTIGKLSPTGIPYPRLDQPPTFLDSLHHTERTLVLAHTIAPPGARPVLLFNDDAAR